MNKHKYIKYTIILFLSIIILSKAKFSSEKFDYSEIHADANIQIYLPSYIPTSYKLQEYDIDDSFVSLIFCSDSKNLYYTQMPAKNFTLSIDNENHTISEFSSDKFTGYLSESKSSPNFCTLSFYDDNNYYELSGTVNKNELFQIAESVEKYIPYSFSSILL